METTNLQRNPISLIKAGIRSQSPYLVGKEEDIRIKLNQNESPYDLPDWMKESLLAQLRTIPFNRYPSDQPIALQQALADFWGLSANNFLISNGSNELTITLAFSLLERGSKVVLAEPMFSLYHKTAKLVEAELIGIPPRPDFSFDEEALLEAVKTHQPVLTVITTPNNPTALSVSKDFLKELLEAAEGFVLVDETYADFIGDGRGIIDWIHTYPNLITQRTFSKALGLAGLRIGYLCAQSSILDELLKGRLPFMIDAFAELTACTVLQNKEYVRHQIEILRDGTKWLYEQMLEIDGLQIVPSDANFIIFRAPISGKSLLNRMKEKGILLRSMAGYTNLTEYVRVNCGTPAENQVFIESLKQVLQEAVN